MIQLNVRLNGTNENPFAKWGLKHNPFPQLGKAEYMQMEMKLNALGGEPIKDENDLRSRLEGFTDEFIEGCVKRFVPGQMVKFTIEFED